MTETDASEAGILDPRARFIAEVIAPTGVSEAVLGAFRTVDRAEFVPPELSDMAHTDMIIPVGPNSTVSQPSFVAMMIERLGINEAAKVLEIGSATGYQAALLSRLAREVHTVEINAGLAEQARTNLGRLGYHNITVHDGDGAKGIPDHAPFDAIIVTAALMDAPQPLLDQLQVGGILLAPIGETPVECNVVILKKVSEGEITRSVEERCAFVPLFSDEAGAWSQDKLKQAYDIRRAREMASMGFDEENRDRFQGWLTETWAADGTAYEDIMPAI